jgi:hypothetical protein
MIAALTEYTVRQWWERRLTSVSMTMSFIFAIYFGVWHSMLRPLRFPLRVCHQPNIGRSRGVEDLYSDAMSLGVSARPGL